MVEGKGVRLKDKIAIITDGAEGIGYSYASIMLAAGVNVKAIVIQIRA